MSSVADQWTEYVDTIHRDFNDDDVAAMLAIAGFSFPQERRSVINGYSLKWSLVGETDLHVEIETPNGGRHLVDVDADGAKILTTRRHCA